MVPGAPHQGTGTVAPGIWHRRAPGTLALGTWHPCPGTPEHLAPEGTRLLL
jgi:hypothetical protein